VSVKDVRSKNLDDFSKLFWDLNKKTRGCPLPCKKNWHVMAVQPISVKCLSFILPSSVLSVMGCPPCY